MGNVNWGILTPGQQLDPIQSAAPQAKTAPAPSGGGDGGGGGGLGGLGGLLKGLGGMGGGGGDSGGVGSMFGDNPVSVANSAITQTMQQTPPQQVAQSVLPQSTMASQQSQQPQQPQQPQQGQQPNAGTALSRYTGNPNQSSPLLSQQQTVQGQLYPNNPGNQNQYNNLGALPSYYQNQGTALNRYANPQQQQQNPIGQAYNAANPNLMSQRPPAYVSPVNQQSIPQNVLPSLNLNQNQMKPAPVFSPQDAVQQQMTSPNPMSIDNVKQMAAQAFPNNPNMQQVAVTQAAHESNLLGTPSGLARNQNNLFGMTGSGNAGSKTMTGNLDSSPQQFAAYKSPQDSMNAYANLMQHPRYQDVVNAKTPEEAFQALQKAGYATDKNYANGLTAVNNRLSQSSSQSNPASAHNSVSNATQASKTGDPYSTAQSFLGTDSKTHAQTLSSFFQKSGQGKVDPQTTPWCAAFANSVFQSNGVKGTGSLAAKSFLNWGTPTSSPSKGDVVVFNSLTGAGPTHGHVGFFDSIVSKNGQQYVHTLGGNQGGSVSYRDYPLSKVAGFRQPPSSNEIMAKTQQSSPGLLNNQQSQNSLSIGQPQPTNNIQYLQQQGIQQQPQGQNLQLQGSQSPGPQQVNQQQNQQGQQGQQQGQPGGQNQPIQSQPGAATIGRPINPLLGLVNYRQQ